MEQEFDDLFCKGLPDYSNEKADFWIDKSTTKYLKTGARGTTLPKLKKWVVFFVKTKESKEESWVLFDGTGIVQEAKGFSDLIAKVEILRLKAMFGRDLYGVEENE